jgi:catechol 2,3-dioxygenase-like lactoylglutathione lyase family enzyme
VPEGVAFMVAPTGVRLELLAPEPGLRIAFVADPDGNLVELLSGD